MSLAGQVFDQWAVIGKAATQHWLCMCQCGSIREVRQRALVSGHSTSCGCRHRARAVALMNERRTTHGHARKKNQSRTYRIWTNMKARCSNPSLEAYKNYGGRGIRICARWRESFENFLADMGEAPADRSIDRINNDGNYEPGNCRWATRLEQANNRRRRGG